MTVLLNPSDAAQRLSQKLSVVTQLMRLIALRMERSELKGDPLIAYLRESESVHARISARLERLVEDLQASRTRVSRL